MSAATFEFPPMAERHAPTGQGKIVVGFAGGGGSCTGIAAALGREIDDALNHDWPAVCMHKANHPGTNHWCQSIWSADPVDVAGGRAIDVAWFSPDCKHFSKAKGGKPVEKHIRDLAWVVVHYATRLARWQRPKVILLENVEEFRGWGPLIETEKGLVPDPDRKGEEFERWVKALKKAGYRSIEWREMRACDYGAPTIRKRLFLIARCDGLPIVWPEPTHGDPKSEAVKAGKLLPWRTAAECIDWSIPCPSIFERSKPLKEATCRRIAAGIMRYVVNAQKPFIVPLTHHGSSERLVDIDQPMPTVTGANRGEMAVVEPFVIPITHTTNGGAGRSTADPLATVTTAKGGEFALIAPHVMTMRNAGKPFQCCDEPTHTVTAGGAHQCLVAATIVGCGGRAAQSRPRGADEPVATITAKADACVVEARLMAPVIDSQYGNSAGADADRPMPTVTAGGSGKQAMVAAFLAQHNSGFYEGSGRAANDPVSTVTASGSQQGVVTSHLVKLRGTCADGQPVDEPMPTITAGGMHVGEVRAFLMKYYGNETDGHDLAEPLGTVTTKDRFSLVTVTVEGQEYVIVDIGMRMLKPRELARAQGFPDDYILDPVCDYTTDSGAVKTGPLPLTHQIAKIGNSVCPPMAEALTRANCMMYAAPELMVAAE